MGGNDELHSLFMKHFGVDPDTLREDQIKALALLNSEAKDIIESKEKVLFCCLRVNEPDLLKDRPVYLAFNIRREPLKQMITHAYHRLVVQDRICDDVEEKPSTDITGNLVATPLKDL